jgi:hypothetical protein
MTFERVLPVFGVVFALVYLLAVEYNWALFTYHPQINQWGYLVEPPRTGPAMYWYGWLTTASLAGIAGCLVALAVPQGVMSRIPTWVYWSVPVGVIVFFCYLLRGYFLR